VGLHNVSKCKFIQKLSSNKKKTLPPLSPLALSRAALLLDEADENNTQPNLLL
jgi:hypothetical protein